MLDEDGRCRKTDLFPEQCGCIHHRGGEELDDSQGATEYDGLLISRFLIAHYNGKCAITPSHKIEAGSDIGMVVHEDDIHKNLGWACETCVRTIVP
jgi:hypothetical protein